MKKDMTTVWAHDLMMVHLIAEPVYGMAHLTDQRIVFQMVYMLVVQTVLMYIDETVLQINKAVTMV